MLKFFPSVYETVRFCEFVIPDKRLMEYNVDMIFLAKLLSFRKEYRMKRVSTLLLTLGLILSASGCGETLKKTTQQKKEKLNCVMVTSDNMSHDVIIEHSGDEMLNVDTSTSIKDNKDVLEEVAEALIDSYLDLNEIEGVKVSIDTDSIADNEELKIYMSFDLSILDFDTYQIVLGGGYMTRGINKGKSLNTYRNSLEKSEFTCKTVDD